MKSVARDLAPSFPLLPRSEVYGLWGDMRMAQTDPLGYFLKLGREQNGLARFRAGLWDVYLVAHPEAVSAILREHYKSYSKRTFTYEMVRSVGGEGLLTLDGDAWHQRRRMMQPIFSKERVAALDRVVTKATDAMLDRWTKTAQPKEGIDLVEQVNELTLTIAAQAFFQVDLEESKELRQAITDLSNAHAIRLRSKWFALFALMGRLSPTNRQVQSARKTLGDVTQRIIQELHNHSQVGDNILVQLAQAHHPDTGGGLSKDDLHSEVTTLLLAGNETTSRALTWCLYLLSRHPEIAEKVALETQNFPVGNQLTFADFEKLEYSRWVIQEALRLYPPVYAFSRRAERDEVVNGYRIPRGARILISPYVAHRLPEFWTRPDEFIPERFSPDECKKRPNLSYLPFGAGPRQCIGQRFAMLEMQIIIPMILQRFTLFGTNDAPILPEPQGTLTPSQPIRLKIYPR